MYTKAKIRVELSTERGIVVLPEIDTGKGPDDFAAMGAHLGAAIQSVLDHGMFKPGQIASAELTKARAKIAALEAEIQKAKPAQAPAAQAPQVAMPPPITVKLEPKHEEHKGRRGR